MRASNLHNLHCATSTLVGEHSGATHVVPRTCSTVSKRFVVRQVIPMPDGHEIGTVLRTYVAFFFFFIFFGIERKILNTGSAAHRRASATAWSTTTNLQI